MDTIILKTRSEVKVSDPKMVHDTPLFQDASTHQIWNSLLQDAFSHQIWNSYLKEYRRYARDSM